MTIDELDRQVVEKKFAQMTIADGAAIMNLSTTNLSSIDRLIKLNLVKMVKSSIQLTKWGLLIKKKLEPQCPF